LIERYSVVEHTPHTSNVGYIPATDVFVEHDLAFEKIGKVCHIFRETPSANLSVVVASHCVAYFIVAIENPGAVVTTRCLGRNVRSQGLVNRRSEKQCNEKDHADLLDKVIWFATKIVSKISNPTKWHSGAFCCCFQASSHFLC
jgi:hypothetical protein